MEIKISQTALHRIFLGNLHFSFSLKGFCKYSGLQIGKKYKKNALITKFFFSLCTLQFEIPPLSSIIFRGNLRYCVYTRISLLIFSNTDACSDKKYLIDIFITLSISVLFILNITAIRFLSILFKCSVLFRQNLPC